MQIMFALGLEHALGDHDAELKSRADADELATQPAAEEVRRKAPTVRVGLQDDTYFVGSAQALEESWDLMSELLGRAGHRLRAFKCA